MAAANYNCNQVRVSSLLSPVSFALLPLPYPHSPIEPFNILASPSKRFALVPSAPLRRERGNTRPTATRSIQQFSLSMFESDFERISFALANRKLVRKHLRSPCLCARISQGQLQSANSENGFTNIRRIDLYSTSRRYNYKLSLRKKRNRSFTRFRNFINALT